MKKQERLDKINEIINFYSSKKNDESKKSSKLIEKFKKVDQKEFTKNKDVIKRVLDKIQKKIKLYDTIIKSVRKVASNPWIPVPLMSSMEEEEKIEKFNEDIEMNNILLEIGKLDPFFSNKAKIHFGNIISKRRVR